MDELNNNKWWIILAILIAIIFIAVFGIFFLNSRKTTENSLPTLKSNDFDKDYSKLDEITPGKSTLADVRRVNGEPKAVKNEGDKTYLTYNTPAQGFENVVLIENDRVVYSKENVFGNYRGSVSEFKSKNGDPDLLLFSENYGWSVYLTKGIAIQHDARDIGTILYFIPQSKNSFMNTIAKDLNLTETPPAIEEPPFEGSATEAFPTP